MYYRQTMKKIVLLFAALLLFAAACGGDTAVDTTSVADEVEVEDAGESASQDAGPTAVPEPTATEVPPTPEPFAPSPAFAAAVQAVIDADHWCAAAEAAEAGMMPLDTLNFNDPVQVEQGMRQSLGVVTASLRLVPPEIAADVTVTVEAFTAMIGLLEAVNWSLLDLDLTLLQTSNDAEELAAYNIEKYNFEQCGMGEDPGEPPTFDTTPDIDDGEALEGTVRDEVIAQFRAVGFTEEEANCILDNIDFAEIETLRDPSILFPVLEACSIPMSRLGELSVEE